MCVYTHNENLQTQVLRSQEADEEVAHVSPFFVYIRALANNPTLHNHTSPTIHGTKWIVFM